MHEFHAWIGLGESAFEHDEGHLKEKLDQLRELVADEEWHDAVFAVHSLNGGYFFTATGLINRQRDEGERLNLFLATIARRLPGSKTLTRNAFGPYGSGISSSRS